MARETDMRSIIKKACEIGAIDLSTVEDFESPMAMRLGIYSEPQTCFDPVEYVVVHGGAGITVTRRLFHAVKAIVNNNADFDVGVTPSILILTGERDTTEAERGRIKEAGFAPESTEFDLAISAISTLYPNAQFYERPSVTAKYDGSQHVIRHHEAKFSCCGVDIIVQICETSYDPERKLADGSKATRANFEEAMAPLLLNKEQLAGKKIYFVSHDIWQPRAKLRLQALLPKTTIVGNGPHNLNRLSISRNDDGQIDITVANVDELISEIEAYDRIIESD